MAENQEEQKTLETVEQDIFRKITEVVKQNSLLLEQISDLSIAVYSQSDQMKQTKDSVLKEIKKFQALSAQRAMSAIFNKLFHELIEHINRIDELLAIHGEDNQGDSWIESISIVRDHFEKILVDWGCRPTLIELGREQFDPEVHEAVEASDIEIPVSVPENTIIKVVRRGWKLYDHVLQYPQVIVS